MIHIHNAQKSYGEREVLNIESLDIDKGACFGLVGNNGAGKTTLFRALLDLIPLDAGIIAINDIQVSTSENWKEITGAFLDEGFLIDYLKPEEYFVYVGKTRGLTREQTNQQLERFSELFGDEIIGQKRFIRDLSKGNQKKVGIAASFIGNPDVVILDEPFANLDPSSQFILRELIDEEHKNGVTFLISSHDLSHVTEICSRIVLLDRGKVVKDLKTNPSTLNELEDHFRRIKQ